MLALQTAFASPTPLDDAVMAKRDEYVYDARVAGDDENPPSNVQFPKRQDEMTEVKPRQLAPASISSTDGKYLMGASPCDQDKDISRYFLFSGGKIRTQFHSVCRGLTYLFYRSAAQCAAGL